MIFRVYFEIAGKKLKADIEAVSGLGAINKIKESLDFKKAVLVHTEDCEVVDKLKSILGVK